MFLTTEPLLLEEKKTVSEPWQAGISKAIPGQTQLAGSCRKNILPARPLPSHKPSVLCQQDLAPEQLKGKTGSCDSENGTNICDFVLSPMIYSIFLRTPADGSMLLHEPFGALEAWS